MSCCVRLIVCWRACLARASGSAVCSSSIRRLRAASWSGDRVEACFCSLWAATRDVLSRCAASIAPNFFGSFFVASFFLKRLKKIKKEKKLNQIPQRPFQGPSPAKFFLIRFEKTQR